MDEKNNPTVKNKKRKKPKKVKKARFTGDKSSRKNLILIGGSVLLVIILSATIFATLSSLFSTETYYVLNTNIRAKQEISPDMVVARETAARTAPVNALSMEVIQRGGVYSRYPLYSGDVVSHSNAGPLSGEALGIPDDWSVTSFSINSTDAVGGILGKGDYIDIIGINNNGAQYIFNNLLILEVKFVNEEYDNLDGQTIIGETMHYTIGLPAEDIGYFHSALYNYSQGEESGDIKIIKAPYELNYAERDVSELDEVFRYGPEIGNIDLFEGTDPTFTDVERDEDGRPISQEENGRVGRRIDNEEQEALRQEQESLEQQEYEDNFEDNLENQNESEEVASDEDIEDID